MTKLKIFCSSLLAPFALTAQIVSIETSAPTQNLLIENVTTTTGTLAAKNEPGTGNNRAVGFAFTAPSTAELESLAWAFTDFGAAGFSSNFTLQVVEAQADLTQPVLDANNDLNVLYQETFTTPSSDPGAGTGERFLTFTFANPYELQEDSHYAIVGTFDSTLKDRFILFQLGTQAEQGPEVGGSFYTGNDFDTVLKVPRAYKYALTTIPEPSSAAFWVGILSIMGLAGARRIHR